MAEELLKVQKLESVGILAGGIAHDFNNLLTSIVGNISLAKLYTSADQESYKWLTGAEKASERAADLTRQLLTFSKGGKPVRTTASIVEPLKEAVEFTLSGSKVLPEFDIPRDIWNVEADIGQMSQVFHNLVINAMQAMPEGGRLTVRAMNIELGKGDVPALKEGRYVRITMRDTGMGIPPEHLARIFDPYFTTKQSGSGLGLSTVFSIIKNHDGHITVESALSKGTSFNIYLPASEKAYVLIRKEEHNIRTGGSKVLVMDDETMVQRIAGDMLKSLGYEAQFAVDGHEALAKYKTSLEEGVPFDVVIMDLTIPGGMGGKEAIQGLLDLDPKARAIVSSGYSDDPLIADYRNYGFKGALAKPYRLRELSSMMRRVLEEGTSA
jgi:CheY-like chemotaxis protein